MPYLKNNSTNTKSFLLVMLVIALSSVASTISVASEFQVLRPQHDDAEFEPIIKGTASASCQSGVSAGFACKNVELLSRMPLDQLGGGSGADSWGWKDIETGRYYALMARSTGTSFVDVTEPESPVYLGNLPTTSGNRVWRDVKVYANHAFIVADGIAGHGMQVFDLTRLRGLDTPQVFTMDAFYGGVGSAHNIAINEDSGYAYIVGSTDCEGGLHMVDISNPTRPQFAGCFADDGYTHDVQCVMYAGPDMDHQGAEICFASNEDSLTIVDVSNKSAATMLSKVAYPNVGFSHQGWLDDDQSLFFMSDETDELSFGMNTRTLMFDVSDLDNPQFTDAYQHSTTAIDHNLYVRGDFIFQANYLAGMRVLRIERGEGIKLSEVAYFDTAPDEDSLGFGGAWNVYPFFDNGIILVSDMNSGLFVLGTSLDDDNTVTPPIDGRTSGVYVSDGLNDQGITLFVGENMNGPFVFYEWFTFLDGAPFWLVGTAAFEYGVDEIAISTQRLSGLDFDMPGSEKAIRERIGTLTIHVHACDELHVEYDFDELGARALDFQRIGTVQGRECTE